VVVVDDVPVDAAPARVVVVPVEPLAPAVVLVVAEAAPPANVVMVDPAAAPPAFAGDVGGSEYADWFALPRDLAPVE
jgi:hypothetical protein